MIKKQDDAVVKGYDIDQYDESALTGRSMADIAWRPGIEAVDEQPSGIARRGEGALAGGCDRQV